MKKEDLNKWWSGLTVTQKEHIASKVVSKRDGPPTQIHYPACTVVWNELSDEQQEFIHDHCTDKHGMILPEWQEGDTYSY